MKRCARETRARGRKLELRIARALQKICLHIFVLAVRVSHAQEHYLVSVRVSVCVPVCVPVCAPA